MPALRQLVKRTLLGTGMRRTGMEARGVRARTWQEDPALRPWFDQPDALARLPAIADRWQLDDEGRMRLQKWVADGYFVVENLIPPDVIDRFVAHADDLWFRRKPFRGLRIAGVVVDGKQEPYMSHAEVLALPLGVRRAAQRASDWRVSGYHEFEPAAAALFHWQKVRDICSAIFDRPAVPRYSLTFAKGSQQEPHQDTCVFHVWPRNFLAGVWIACEDIHEDAGPLEYWPGSHREPLFAEFDNYPQTQRRTADAGQLRRYDEHVRSLTSKYPRQEFLAAKGDALFWHGMLIHGGALVTNPSATRRSFVVHFMPEGADHAAEIAGPFNW